MRDWLARLRASVPPQVLLAFAAALLLLSGGAFGGTDGGASALERRASRVLSAVSGAGKVDVVIRMRALEGESGGARSAGEIPCGAVAVAQGADDPVVHYELQQALCALLALPPSSVSIAAGGG